MATATTTRSLPMARTEFITALNRDTGKTERPRFLEVLDAIVAWSVARPDRLRFRNDETKPGVISFERVGSNVVFWSVHPRRGADPTVEFIPRSASVLSEADRAEVMNALNAHSRESLTKDDKLRIGFGALKNQTARAAILTMMEQLLLVT
jgi:hypothetical protein